ncbi:TIGR01621 family pseudouridine synthase [Burkholderiaceae bacterium DAT-1]|nr:TIGR01621 family pseudouridine synthase [Burkholderiaceae bacterium DAT-1]
MYTLLQQTSDFLVIHKWPGISVHRDEGDTSLIDQIRADTGIADLHSVHRLDKMTSGILLYAIGAANARALSQSFEHGEIEKYYLAISDKRPAKKQGAIIGDMTAARNGSYKLLQTRNNPARTRFFSQLLPDGKRAFILRPLTGRTHQLRVALKSLGSPILGDERYGGTSADRGYLHAYAIRFTLHETVHAFICPPDSGTHWPSADLLTESGWHTPWSLPWPQ